MNTITKGTSEEKKRRAEIPSDPAETSRFYTEDKKTVFTREPVRHYFMTHDAREPIITASAERIDTKSAHRDVVNAALALAETRGWTSLKINGTPEFKREAAIQAAGRGLTIDSYTLTPRDEQEVARRTQATAQAQRQPPTQPQAQRQQAENVTRMQATQPTARVGEQASVAQGRQAVAAMSA